MDINEVAQYQIVMRKVVERAKTDPTFNKQIWKSPVETLTACGVCELDIVKILRNIQISASIPDADFNGLYHSLDDRKKIY
jgi:hypothetical protein